MNHQSQEPSRLPTDLPVPDDDGAADHLPGLRLPPLALPSTDGGELWLNALSTHAPRVVVYAYPRTGRPGEEPLTPDWDAIPGARGCTPESCGFRDHAAELRAAGADVVGLSTQDTSYQQEMVQRLQLPFPVLSDHQLTVTRALQLPTFEAGGQVLLRRLTMVVRADLVESVFYPVFPPDGHAEQVLAWLREHTR